MATNTNSFILTAYRRLDRVIRRMANAEVELDALLRDFAAMVTRSPVTVSGAMSPGGAGGLLRGRNQLKNEIELAAEAHAGAWHYETIRLASGAARVHVNERIFFLSPKLSELLRVLAEADPTQRSTQGLIAWKSRSYVRQELSTRTGAPVTDHALDNLVCRLRREFRNAGLHEHFIQRSPKYGLRFARQQR